MDSPLFDSAFRTLLAQYPLFIGDEVDDLAAFLTGRLMGGDGVALLEEVLKGSYRPHKRLLITRVEDDRERAHVRPAR